MTVSAASFVGTFPAFSNMEPTTVTFWLGVAVNLVDPSKFGNMTDAAVSLATAHYLSLAQRAQEYADAGAGPDLPRIQTGKNVGGLASSYDVGAATIPGEGQWNLTIYGTQFVDLRNMFGAGGIQLF